MSDPLLKDIAKYKKDPSVRLIKNTFQNLSIFSFQYVDESGCHKEIMNLNNSEASSRFRHPSQNH